MASHPFKNNMEESDNVIDTIKKRNTDAIEQMKNELLFSKDELDVIVELIEKQVIQENRDVNCIKFGILLYSSKHNVGFSNHFARWHDVRYSAYNVADSKLIQSEFTSIITEVCQTIVDLWNNKHPKLIAQLIGGWYEESKTWEFSIRRSVPNNN